MDTNINTNITSDKLLLTINEAAEQLSITPRTLQRIVHIQDFPTIHIGRRILIPADALRQWVHDNTGAYIPTQEDD